MNQRKAILSRADRCKSQFPKQEYTTAHLALCGDIRADAQFIDTLCKPRRSFWQRLKDGWRAMQ